MTIELRIVAVLGSMAYLAEVEANVISGGLSLVGGAASSATTRLSLHPLDELEASPSSSFWWASHFMGDDGFLLVDVVVAIPRYLLHRGGKAKSEVVDVLTRLECKAIPLLT